MNCLRGDRYVPAMDAKSVDAAHVTLIKSEQAKENCNANVFVSSPSKDSYRKAVAKQLCGSSPVRFLCFIIFLVMLTMFLVFKDPLFLQEGSCSC